MALPVLVLAAPWLFSSRTVYGRDFDVYYRPHAIFAREAFARDGRLPAWNPYQYAGTPFLGNFQLNLHYPPNRLFLAMAPDEAHEILLVLHLLLGVAGMYRLARFFRLRRPSCVLAALAFGLSFSSSARIYAGHLPYLVTQCQAPLLIGLLLRLIDRPGLARTAALGAWIAAVLLAGNPHFLYQLALLSAAVAAWRLVGAPSRKAAAGAVVAAAAIGVLVAAVQLVPAAEVAAWATRGRAASFYGDAPVPRHHAFIPENFASFLIPRFPWTEGVARLMDRDWWHEKAVYVGVLPLMTAAFALLGRRRGPAIFFAVAAAVALLDGMARHLPVHALLSLLPGYGSFRVPGRSVWIAVLSLALLSGFGWEALLRGDLPERTKRAALGAVAGAIALSAGFFAIRFGARAEAALLLGLAAVGAALIFFAGRRPAAAWAAAFLAALDLCVAGLGVQRTVERDRLGAAPWYARPIGPGREAYRLLDLGHIEARPVEHRFRLLEGLGYPALRPLDEFYATAWEDPPGDRGDSLAHGTRLRDSSVLDRLNVRWIVTRGPPLDARWREVAREGDEILYENPSARSLAFFEEGGQAEATRPAADRIEVTCRTSEPRALIIAESWMPGWRGTPPVERAGALMRIEVPAGESRVALEYRPASGAVVSAFGLLALAGVLLAAARRRSRKAPH